MDTLHLIQYGSNNSVIHGFQTTFRITVRYFILDLRINDHIYAEVSIINFGLLF